MKRINKFVIPFIAISVFSLVATNVFAEEIFDDVAPFSDEAAYHEIKLDVVSNNLNETKTNIVTPRITSPINNGKIDGPQMIKGEVESGYDVKVFVDEKYVKTIDVWESKTGLSGFFYEPEQKMSLGIHNIRFTAVKNGVEFGSSEKINFEVISGYTTPEILTPYYYADDFSTYVIRGNANIGSRLEVYVDGVKVRYVNSLKNTYFALAVKGLKVGDHKAYVVTYSEDGKASESKTVYFKVIENKNTEVKEEIKEETVKETVKQEEVKQEAKEEIKEEIKQEIETSETNNKKDKSILIGIILLVVAVILILVYLISENKDKVKKFVDNLFEEDEDDSNKEEQNK